MATSLDIKMSEGAPDVKAIDDGTNAGYVPYGATGYVDVNNNFVKASVATPLPVVFGSASRADIVSTAASGTASSASSTIANSTVAANTVFTGNVIIAATLQQAAALNAAGSLSIWVGWTGGSSGTPSQRVAALDFVAPANGVSGAGFSDSGQIVVPLTLYAGTTSGSFNLTASSTGTVSGLTYDVVINGTNQ